jgi:hypothetical protein
MNGKLSALLPLLLLLLPCPAPGLPRIVGGTEAEAHQIPFIVSLQAGHCLPPPTHPSPDHRVGQLAFLWRLPVNGEVPPPLLVMS